MSLRSRSVRVCRGLGAVGALFFAPQACHSVCAIGFFYTVSTVIHGRVIDM